MFVNVVVDGKMFNKTPNLSYYFKKIDWFWD